MADCTRVSTQRQTVQDRRQHPHVVGGGPIHAGRGRRQAAEDIAAPHHHRDLDPQSVDRLDFPGDKANHLGADPIALVSRQCLPTDLEDDSLVFQLHHSLQFVVHGSWFMVKTDPSKP
jgi:hypothetical protein